MEDVASIRKKLLDEYQYVLNSKNKLVLDLGRTSRVYDKELEEQIKLKIYEKNRRLEQIAMVCKKIPALDLMDIEEVFAAADAEKGLYGNQLKSDVENIK